MNKDIFNRQNKFDTLMKHSFYVDKTAFINEWWNSQDDVTMILRPHGFGKTVVLDMVERFFSMESSDKVNIFKQYTVWENIRIRELCGRYPVIYISFSDISANCYEQAIQQIGKILNGLYVKHQVPMQVGSFNNDADMILSIQNLCRLIKREYGQKPIILLDDYDIPLQAAYEYGYYSQLILFMSGLFNATFKANPYFERGLITGTVLSGELIFSCVNNMEIVTVLSEKYKTSFGFTECEVRKLLQHTDMSMSAIQEWYGGFSFGSVENICNIASLVHFSNSGKYDMYRDSLFPAWLQNWTTIHSDPSVELCLSSLLQGKIISISMNPYSFMEQIEHDFSIFWSLLVHMGYLQIVKAPRDLTDPDQQYYLKLTNRESQILISEII